MKILLFIDSLGAGGAQRQLVGLAKMLLDRGFRVKVCSYHEVDFYKSDLDDAGVPNEIIAGAASPRWRMLLVRRYIKRERPDWVIAYLETPSLIASAIRLMGVRFKLLVSERNTTQVVGTNERVRFFLYRWADAIVPNSYSQERWMLEHYPWMKSKITTITNFVDLDRFQFVEHRRHLVPEIIVVASVWASKNTLGFIKALAILKNREVRCHVSWYGIAETHQDYLDECEKLISKSGVSDYIDLLPKTNEIVNKYQESDYFCLPSFYEGTPNVICEAMASGLPIICSNICDNSHYVIEGENGVMFNPHEPDSIADGIQRLLLQSDSEFQSFGVKSRNVIEEISSPQRFIEKYMNILSGSFNNK